MCATLVVFRPFRGWTFLSDHPRLTPWAALFRRSAAIRRGIRDRNSGDHYSLLNPPSVCDGCHIALTQLWSEHQLLNIPLHSAPPSGIKEKPSRAVWQAGLLNLS